MTQWEFDEQRIAETRRKLKRVFPQEPEKAEVVAQLLCSSKRGLYDFDFSLIEKPEDLIAEALENLEKTGFPSILTNRV